MALHHRPVYPEHLHRFPAISHGDSSVRRLFHSPRRLDDLLRSAGRIPPSSDPSRIASVSSLHHGRSPLSVQGAVLRADNCPSGLYTADGSNIRRPPLSDQPLPMPSYTLSSIRGKALEQEFQDLLHKQAIEQAPQTPGFYSLLFVVQKDSGAWCPIIDLSTLNTYIASQRFHMETPQSVVCSIRQGDWMISLDLQDAYLQVPIHPESRRYLRFTMGGVPYQFRVLCFGLTTAPQVFTRLMAPISDDLLCPTNSSPCHPMPRLPSGEKPWSRSSKISSTNKP